MKRISFKWLAAGLVLSAIGVGATAFNHEGGRVTAESSINWKTTAVSTTTVENEAASQSYAKSLSGAFRSASEKVLPSVVTIRSTASTSPSRGDLQGGNIPEELRNNPMFKRFFEGLPEGNLEAPEGRERSGMGSGVIIDSSGIILTNNHVVKGADKLLVKLHDGREFEAKEWKTDPKTDIAVVRIESATSLPVASIGNSDELEIGDWVIAVGAPFGLDETVTAGIISAKSRGIGITDREEFLQTDAAINPGNSGGPLVNLNGDVVGINTAISSTSGGCQGIGFAIPVNLARWVGDELMAHGTVQRAFLGVGIQSIDNTLSKQLGLNTVKGAVVTDVREGSPAAKSGLQSGDVIVEFDGVAISKPSDLQGRVERASVSDVHNVVVIRDGKTMSLSVSVQAMPANLISAGESRMGSSSESEFSDLGLQLSDLTEDVAKQLGMEDADGVMITGIKSGSISEKAGLSEGMVITKVGRFIVKNMDEFRSAIQAASVKDGVLMLVRTGQSSRFVVVKG